MRKIESDTEGSTESHTKKPQRTHTVATELNHKHTDIETPQRTHRVSHKKATETHRGPTKNHRGPTNPYIEAITGKASEDTDGKESERIQRSSDVKDHQNSPLDVKDHNDTGTQGEATGIPLINEAPGA